MKEARPERFHTFSAASHASFDNTCLVFPWLRLITERIKFTLLEFWLFTMLCGVSIGRMLASMLINPHATHFGIALTVYFAVHLHAAFFSAVGEALYFKQGPTLALSCYRMTWFAITQTVPFMITQWIAHANLNNDY